MYLEDLFTISANLAGLPAMSLPNGNIDNKPIGLQIIGNFLDESSILNFGHMYQTKTTGICIHLKGLFNELGNSNWFRDTCSTFN